MKSQKTASLESSGTNCGSTIRYAVTTQYEAKSTVLTASGVTKDAVYQQISKPEYTKVATVIYDKASERRISTAITNRRMSLWSKS